MSSSSTESSFQQQQQQQQQHKELFKDVTGELLFDYGSFKQGVHSINSARNKNKIHSSTVKPMSVVMKKCIMCGKMVFESDMTLILWMSHFEEKYETLCYECFHFCKFRVSSDLKQGL